MIVSSMKGICIVVSSLVLAAAIQVGAQTDYPVGAPPPAPGGQILAPAQLNQLLAPIALYPDPLIAQILPAAEQPSQIAVAANYLNGGGDPNQTDSQPWDSSVKAIAHYPQVLQMMDGNLQWTAELGQAFENQPTDVMNAIQSLRAQAQQQGNLQNTPQDTIENDDGTIEIVPTNPDVLYVPEYDPSLIYYQPGIYCNWGVGFAIGPWFDHDFDWFHHRVIAWGHDHPRPGGWWHEPFADRRAAIARAPEWHPSARPEPVRGFAPVNRGDRGYAPVARPAPAREAPVREAPVREARPAPVVREAPPRAPTVFSHESAPEARAASSRGAVSRGGGGGGGARGGGGKR